MSNGRLINEEKIDQKTNEILSTLPEYVSRWHLNLKASRKTAATRKEYVSKIALFLKYINKVPGLVQLDEINETNVTEYFLSTQVRNGAPTSDSYQCAVWSCLNSFFEYLKTHDLITENFMSYIKRPTNRDLDRINEKRVMLTKRDLKKIISAINDERDDIRRIRDMAVIKLFINTGMRETALISIMLDDVNLETRTLTVIDKGNKRHVYDLNDGMCECIQNWLSVRWEYNNNNDDHLFLSERGNGLAVRTVIDLVSKYCERALGKKLSPHKLRSAFCSILYKETGDIEFVRRAVGHSNVATTQRYIVTNGSERKRAAEIMASIT